MIKRIIGPEHKNMSEHDRAWPNLIYYCAGRGNFRGDGASNRVRIVTKPRTGLEAAQPELQTVRLLFERPLRIKHLHLEFREYNSARTQEFALHWSSNGGRSYREIVRQQYNFSPPDTNG